MYTSEMKYSGKQMLVGPIGKHAIAPCTKKCYLKAATMTSVATSRETHKCALTIQSIIDSSPIDTLLSCCCFLLVVLLRRTRWLSNRSSNFRICGYHELYLAILR